MKHGVGKSELDNRSGVGSEVLECGTARIGIKPMISSREEPITIACFCAVERLCYTETRDSNERSKSDSHDSRTGFAQKNQMV
jgi:hypothetical protein